MALSPLLRATVVAASVKYQQEPATGIIPLTPVDIDPRQALIFEVADMISEAVNGPAISAVDLAEMIVDAVQEAA